MRYLSKNSVYTCIFLIILLSSQPAFAKSYSYDYINMSLDFAPDGSVIVTQERAYDFSGSFTYAYLDVLKQGAKDVQFLAIRDLDQNIQLPIQYDLGSDTNHVQATWHYSANNEVRRFEIKYKITGAVKRYEDVAQFYWKVVEDEHEPISKLNVTVNLPFASPNLFKIFVHSSANPGILNFSPDYSKAYVAMENIPRNKFVEFRVLADPSKFYGVTQAPEKQYETILEDEKKIVYTSAVSGMAVPILILLLIIPIAALVYFYFKYGRDPKVEYDVPYEHEPPQKIPPMALSNLLEGVEDEMDISIEARGLLATIFDLALRGYLEVHEVKKKKFFGLVDKTEQIFILTKKGSDEKEKHALLEFESAILDFLMSCGAKPGKASSSEITAYCQRNGIKVKQRIDSIDRNARNWFEENYFPLTEGVSSRDQETIRISMVTYIGFLGIYFLSMFNPISIAVIIFGFVFGAMAGFVVSMLMVMLLSHRTQQSTLQAKRWKAFKRFISDFSAMKDAPATLLHIWDQYLVYAISLGVAEKLLENIKRLSIETGTPIVAVGWYHGTSPISGATISPEAITGFINNLSNTVSALNSSTSVGGGFSGGGGGGGGGGSSGAG